MGIISHGDYCDRNPTYVTKHLELSQNIDSICNFIEMAKKAGL
ncbi:MAG: hypothetical protein O4859_28440 [Trichodesmium sp. St18_bin1]|nr:hypothetical protein [Trichodesmium sp. St18_bin1]MDE5123067.1 hypothetical protein [Trichodesmium sp. St19_bin1]